MGLRDKYAYAIQTAKTLRMQGSADEKDGKLYFHGTVGSQTEVNQIWDAIKTIPTWQSEIVADIKSTGTSGTAGTTGGGSTASTDITAHTYVVRPGDTLSKIAKELLGDGNSYMEIFNANRDQLNDPNVIRPGQVLKIPQHAKG